MSAATVLPVIFGNRCNDTRRVSRSGVVSAKRGWISEAGSRYRSPCHPVSYNVRDGPINSTGTERSGCFVGRRFGAEPFLLSSGLQQKDERRAS
jgi:hypothetical protein